MRLGVGVLAVSMTLVGALRPMRAEEARLAGPQPKQRYAVLCRIIDENDAVLMCPKLILCDGVKGRIADCSQSPFVTGLIPVPAEGHTRVQQPVVQVVEEGTSIDLAVFAQRDGGATVDVTVEQSRIAEAGTKRCCGGQSTRDSDGAPHEGTTLQTVRVDTRRKRVIEWVQFGEVLAVPMGEKRSGETVPRVEVVVDLAEKTPSERPSRTDHRTPKGEEAERKAIFDTLLATGSAKVTCFTVSWWEKSSGHRLHEDLFDLGQDLCDLAGLYCNWCPHRMGWVDVLYLASAPAFLEENSLRNRLRHFELTLFGRAPQYHVLLWDSPSLLSNVELLSRCPDLWGVTIEPTQLDGRVLQAIKKLPVTGQNVHVAWPARNADERR